MSTISESEIKCIITKCSITTKSKPKLRQEKAKKKTKKSILLAEDDASSSTESASSKTSSKMSPTASPELEWAPLESPCLRFYSTDALKEYLGSVSGNESNMSKILEHLIRDRGSPRDHHVCNSKWMEEAKYTYQKEHLYTMRHDPLNNSGRLLYIYKAGLFYIFDVSPNHKLGQIDWSKRRLKEQWYLINGETARDVYTVGLDSR